MAFQFRDCHEYGTHVLAMAEALARTIGPVIEFGVGDYSTRFLEVVCRVQRRRLYHVEHELDWLDRVKPTGTVIETTDPASPSPLLREDRWGVVLVDQGPTGEERWPVAQAALLRADLVLCHDADESEEGVYHYWQHVIPFAADWLRDERLWPYTLVCTNRPTLLMSWPKNPKQE